MLRSLTVASLSPLAAVAFIGCGDDNVCVQAASKINDCRSAPSYSGTDNEEVKFAGDCNDVVHIGANEVVAFKSWSDLYVPCEIDSSTCLCPGLPWFDEYKPPDAISSASP